MNNNLKNVLSAILVITASGLFVFGIYKLLSYNNMVNKEFFETSTVSFKDNVQYIDISASSGYIPSRVKAYANKETILRIKTSGTYDCSIAVSIPQLKYRKNLQPFGVEEISVPAQPKNSVLTGTCSMGMYDFKILFL